MPINKDISKLNIIRVFDVDVTYIENREIKTDTLHIKYNPASISTALRRESIFDQLAEVIVDLDFIDECGKKVDPTAEFLRTLDYELLHDLSMRLAKDYKALVDCHR